MPQPPPPDPAAPRAPGWLRALGAIVLLLLAGSLAYAVAIGVVNLSQIGV